MLIKSFFIPIYKYKVKNWDFKKNNLLNLFNKFEKRLIGNVITSSLDIKTNLLSEEIDLFKEDFLGQNTYKKIITTEAWFQKYDNKMNHAVHSHGPMGFSSICFIEYDKKRHKPTTFISPFGNYLTGELMRYEADVDEGDIIFFPSNLLHYAPINLSHKPRIIISFNLNIIDNINKIKY